MKSFFIHNKNLFILEIKDTKTQNHTKTLYQIIIESFKLNLYVIYSPLVNTFGYP